MPLIPKPSDFRVWAETGIKVSPDNSKYSSGWDTSSPPPYQYFSYLQNKTDQFVAHINQVGMVLWDNATEYQAGQSWVQGSNGSIYKCIQTNTNQNPVTDLVEDYWVLVLVGNRVIDRSEVSNFAMTLLDDTSASQMRTTLGFSSVGSNIVTAASTSAAQTAMGGSTIGRSVFTAANTSSAQTAIGIQTASETVAGLSEEATQAEVDAGTNVQAFVKPSKLKNGFAVSLTTNGYIRLPSWLGNFQMVWGSFTSSSDGNVAVTFPLAFSNQCFGVAPAGTTVVDGGILPWTANGITTTGFNSNRADEVDGTVFFKYFAFGY